jgi:pimeloyl-ACP methyl ester carboxylesterase
LKVGDHGSFFDDRPSEEIQVDDITIGYKTFGAGEPLVLITGYIATMDMWDPLFLERLAEKFQVITFDNRGMGRTTSGDEPWTIDRFALDAAGLIDELNFPKANVLGWSLGGDVALSLAVSDPGKVERLVVYAGDCGGTAKVAASSLRQVLKDHKDVHAHFKMILSELFPPEWMEDHPDYWKSFEFPDELNSPQSVIKQNRAYKDWEGCCERLGEILMPVLIVTGTEDVSTPPENAVMLAQRIPQSWLVRFSGAGHGLQYQDPEGLARVVIDFLELTG